MLHSSHSNAKRNQKGRRVLCWRPRCGSRHSVPLNYSYLRTTTKAIARWYGAIVPREGRIHDWDDPNIRWFIPGVSTRRFLCLASGSPATLSADHAAPHRKSLGWMLLHPLSKLRRAHPCCPFRSTRCYTGSNPGSPIHGGINPSADLVCRRSLDVARHSCRPADRHGCRMDDPGRCRDRGADAGLGKMVFNASNFLRTDVVILSLSELLHIYLKF